MSRFNWTLIVVLLFSLLLCACQPIAAPEEMASELTTEAEEEAFLAAAWEAEEAFATGMWVGL